MLMRVAAAQIACRSACIAENLAMHLGMIAEARDAGVRLLVFPELSLTDYLLRPDLQALGRSRECDELAAISKAAGPMLVSVGFIEADEGGWFYNAQALVSGDGILHVHRKVNLPTYGLLVEGEVYAPGREVKPIDVEDAARIGTLICADTWNPALPWLAAIQQPDVLLVPIASTRSAVGGDFDNPGGWRINLRHTALTYGLPLVMANHCGERRGLNFWGGSRILDATGQELARADDRPALITAAIDHSATQAARMRLPTIRDADPRFVEMALRMVLSTSPDHGLRDRMGPDD
jgi:predicted amidohydrolase